MILSYTDKVKNKIVKRLMWINYMYMYINVKFLFIKTLGPTDIVKVPVDKKYLDCIDLLYWRIVNHF